MLNLDFLSLLAAIVEFLNGILGTLLSLELNIAETSRLAILENFEFARFNRTIFGKKIAQTLLVHLLWEVPHEHVGLAVEVLILLFGKNNLFSINNSVVHTFEASLCFLVAIKIQISIAS